MEKVIIGFIPSHRQPFDENWAIMMRKRSLDAFSKVDGLEIIYPDETLTNNGFVQNDTDAEKVIQLFRENRVNGIIIGTMTFGDEVSALTIASAFPDLPIMLFGTKEGSFKPDGGRRSDSFCGTLSVSSGLHRRNRPFIFAGIIFPEEEIFLKSVTDFICVCSIINGFVGAIVGLVGPRPQRFETCIFSEDAMIRQFKQRVVPISLLDVFHYVDRLEDNTPSVKNIIFEMQEQANLEDVSQEAICKLAKLEYTLFNFAQQHKLSGMAVQCWTAIQEVYGISPCYVMGRLTDQGIMTTCEVDVYGTLTMLCQYLATLNTTPPHFIDWTIRHQEKENTFLSWHCGNAPPSLACEGHRITIKSHSIFSDVLGLDRSAGTAEFQLRPGNVTLCRLVEYDGKFRMLITEGEAVQVEQNLRGSWCWVEVPNLDKLYRTLIEEGFLHHASLIHGNYTQSIKDSCKILGIDTIVE